VDIGPETVSVLLRVWLPDRPGALGVIASRIGAAGGDIVGIDVLERGGGVAIDEFGVILPSQSLIRPLVKEIEAIDGARVEEVATVGHFPDPRLDALESAVRLCEVTTHAELFDALTAYVGESFLAEWVAIVGMDGLLGSWGSPPGVPYVLALAEGATTSALVAAGAAGPDDLAAAPLEGRATLLTGRSASPFRSRERAQLRALARVAERVWSWLDERYAVDVEVAAVPGRTS
jgi:hypothetical protein